jgi:hypothetical protein
LPQYFFTLFFCISSFIPFYISLFFVLLFPVVCKWFLCECLQYREAP